MYFPDCLQSPCGFFAVSLQFLSGFFTVSLLTYFGIYGKTFKNVLIYNLIIYTQNNSIIVQNYDYFYFGNDLRMNTFRFVNFWISKLQYDNITEFQKRRSYLRMIITQKNRVLELYHFGILESQYLRI